MAHCVGKESKRREGGRKKEKKRKPYWGTRYANVIYPQISPTGKPLNERVWPGFNKLNKYPLSGLSSRDALSKNVPGA